MQVIYFINLVCGFRFAPTITEGMENMEDVGIWRPVPTCISANTSYWMTVNSVLHAKELIPLMPLLLKYLMAEDSAQKT